MPCADRNAAQHDQIVIGGMKRTAGPLAGWLHCEADSLRGAVVMATTAKSTAKNTMKNATTILIRSFTISPPAPSP